MSKFDDDPLGDLLSDGSNDSFFEEPKATKRASLTKTPDKKSVSDLFGLDQPKEEEKPKKTDDWLGLKESEKTKTISFEDDDILNTLGLEQKPKERPKTTERESAPKKLDPGKKSAVMDDIFGQEKKLTSLEDIVKNPDVKSKFSAAPSLEAKSKIPSSPKMAQKSPTEGYLLSDGPREGRRTRFQASGINDPLGLFNSERSERSEKLGTGDGAVETEVSVLFPVKAKDLKTKSTPNIGDLPDWLGDASPIKAHKSEAGMSVKAEKRPPSRRNSLQRETAPREVLNTELAQTAEIREYGSLDMSSLLTQQKLAMSHIEYQNASSLLHQQESQILATLQLKKYEDKLIEMQQRQQEMLTKQERQFNSLLEGQFAKQQIMENNMRLQQERINNHIQMLISQPGVPKHANYENDGSDDRPNKKTNSEEKEELYQDVIASLKQKQHEEVFLLEESYKKQIQLLEQTMETVEKRLKTELENISQHYENQITRLKTEHESDIEKYRMKIDEVSQQHDDEIKSIRKNQLQMIEQIRFEYSTMVENIKETKQKENVIFENAITYAERLDSSLVALDVNNRTIGEIKDKLERRSGLLDLARDESIRGKEEEIRLMRETLEKSREATENERAQLMGLVRTLETKLAEQNHNAREERWALQQASAILTARSVALDREIEFNKSSFEREREQLKTLKESMLAEQEKIMLQLTEEKLTHAAERCRLETSLKLNQNYDTQRAKVEVEAALQVAKEAAELTDKERASLQQHQCEIEAIKRNLTDRERKLVLREKELEAIVRNAEQKGQEGAQALTQAKLLESQYNERLRDIQTQLFSLTTREKKLAQEKIAVSKERLQLPSYKQKCSLCDITNRSDTFLPATAEQDLTFTIVDPEIMRMRYKTQESDDG